MTTNAQVDEQVARRKLQLSVRKAAAAMVAVAKQKLKKKRANA